ncbi:MAG: diacylglycerol/polyprenol kinase family protein [Anaerolineae bacterium]
MSQQDILGLVISYVYAFGLLGAGELIRVWRKYPLEFTRKVIHIGAGMWVFGLLALFDHWWAGLIPTASFILFNYISYRFTIFKAMDTVGSTLGTVYFPASVTLLLAILWPRELAYVAVAGVMAMTWGDAFASIIGRQFGRHRYTVRGHQRSWEGSVAMFAFSWASVYLSLLYLAPLSGGQSLLFSLVVALVATAVEAVSPWGLDNITVPLLSSGVLLLLT